MLHIFQHLTLVRMNNKDRFESWFTNHHKFRGKKTTSIRDYLSYNKSIARYLNMTIETFYGIKSIARLKAMEVQLKDIPQFQQAPNKKHLISAIHTYIDFRNWTPPQRSKTVKSKPTVESKPKSPLRIKKEKIAAVTPSMLTLRKNDPKASGFEKIDVIAFNFDGKGNTLIRGHNSDGTSSLYPMREDEIRTFLWGDGKNKQIYISE